MSSFLLHLRVLQVSIKNNFVREFIYRSNMFAMAFADLMWVLIEASFFEVIYSNVDSINGWTRPQTYFFLGIFVAADSLFTTFFQRNFWMFPSLVNQGEFDTLLTKPVNAAFLATTRYVNFSQLANLGLGIWIIQHFGPAAGFEGGSAWLLVIGWVIVGLTAQFLLRFAFVVWSFWTERGFTVQHLYYQMYALANKPDGIYPRAIRFILKTALPFAFIGSVPSQAILGKAERSDYFLLIASLSGFYFLNRFLWRKGLDRYQSASS